jgi:hypothetical protein
MWPLIAGQMIDWHRRIEIERIEQLPLVPIMPNHAGRPAAVHPNRDRIMVRVDSHLPLQQFGRSRDHLCTGGGCLLVAYYLTFGELEKQRAIEEPVEVQGGAPKVLKPQSTRSQKAPLLAIDG